MPGSYRIADTTRKNVTTKRTSPIGKLSWRQGLFARKYAKPIVFGLAFAFIGSAALMVSHAATAAPSGMITGIAGKCIDIRDNNRFNGQTAWLWTCHGGPAQQWTMNSNGTISNQGYCLDVKGGIFTAQTPVWVWQCVGNNAQIWQKQSNGTLRNPASNLCLDDMWGATNDGNPLWLWPCIGGAAQLWDVPTGPAVEWGATVNAPPGGWHRMAKLSDGTWVQATTSVVSGTRSDLTVHRSTDNGRTWTYLSSVNDGNRLVDNGAIYQAPNGNLLLSGRDNVANSSYRIAQWRSINGGLTWLREADIDSVGAGIKGVYEPYYYTAAGNKTVVMWADESRPGFSQVINQRVSADNGRTWGPETVIVSDGVNGRPGMPGVSRMANGQYIAVFEVCGTRACNVFNKKSADGITWPAGVGSQIPGVVCGPSVVGLTDGRVMVTGCRVADNNTATPIVVSTDYGVTWRTNPSAFTDAGQFGGWPALYQSGPSEVMAVGGQIRFGNLTPR